MSEPKQAALAASPEEKSREVYQNIIGNPPEVCRSVIAKALREARADALLEAQGWVEEHVIGFQHEACATDTGCHAAMRMIRSLKDKGGV